MRLNAAATVVLASAVLLSGCTRSLQVKYTTGWEDPQTVRAPAKQKLAVLPFTDARSWVDASDPKSASFIAQAGAWKFGLSYDRRDYVPVSTIVQHLFVDELNAAGYDAAASAKPATDGYTLSGKIMTFEFQNEAGFVTVTSRRSVTLALTITDARGAKLGEDLLFTENDKENEGMGVTHGTNVDKLFNRVFKKVVGDVLVKLHDRFQGAQVKVSVNGVAVDMPELLAAN